MPRDFIVRADDPSGKNISTKKVNDTGVDYYLQDVIVNDPDGTRARVVSAPPGGSDPGMVVRVPNLPLPAGAASELTLAAILAALGAGIVVDASGSSLTISGTVPISALALPLPAGAATDVVVQAIRDRLPAALVGGRVDVNVGASALPSGAATQTTLAAILTQLGIGIAVNASGSTVSISGTVPISAATLPLPTGAATDTVLQAVRDRLPAAFGAGGGIKVDGSGTALPISAASLPARTRTADAISAALQTDAIMNGLTALTPKWASVSLAADGNLVAAVTSKKIRLMACALNNAGSADGTLAIKSNNAGGTALTGAMLLRIGGGYVLPFNPTGWLETASGEALYADLTTISALAGVVEYIEV